MLAPTITGRRRARCTTNSDGSRRRAVGATRRPPPGPITATPPTSASAGRKKEEKKETQSGRPLPGDRPGSRRPIGPTTARRRLANTQRRTLIFDWLVLDCEMASTNLWSRASAAWSATSVLSLCHGSRGAHRTDRGHARPASPTVSRHRSRRPAADHQGAAPPPRLAAALLYPQAWPGQVCRLIRPSSSSCFVRSKPLVSKRSLSGQRRRFSRGSHS